jgi:hypothetical protein
MSKRREADGKAYPFEADVQVAFTPVRKRARGFCALAPCAVLLLVVVACSSSSNGAGSTDGGTDGPANGSGADSGTTTTNRDSGSGDASGSSSGSDAGRGGGPGSGSDAGSGSDSGAGGDSGSSSDSGTCATNSDANLESGVAFSANCTTAPCYSAGSVIKTSGGTALWSIDVDAFGSSAGSGNMSIDYSGTGSISWTIDYSGLNSTPINGYPNVTLGNSDGATSATPGNQGLVFPQLLSEMTSLVIDTKYALTCTTCPGNMDVMFDQWLTPTASFSGGQSGSQEVSIFLYYKFAESETTGTPVASVTEPVTLDGTTTADFVWDIFAPGGLTPGHQIDVVPHANQTGTMAGELSFDQLPILKKVASLAGETDWYFSGVILGTEFGDGAAANFNFTLDKLSVSQCH